MQKPSFVTLGSHRLKAQRWQQNAGSITFTTVIRGENLGTDVVHAIGLPEITLAVDGDKTLTGSARLLDQRTTGVGTTAVVRLEIEFRMNAESKVQSSLTIDEKLAAILAEVQELRREVAALREPNRRRADTDPTLLRPGSTMLDFEIPLDSEEPV